MPRPSLRVLTLNAHMGFTPLNRRFILQELREAVRAAAADLVFLQEVIGSDAKQAQRHKNWPQATQYEYLADTLWSDHAYGRNAVYPHGDHGNALLSRFPIRSHRNHDASRGRTEARGFLHCLIDMGDMTGGVLHAICVHLGLFERERGHQLDLLCRLIERDVPADAPLVVAGDFNDWRKRAHEHLSRCAGLRDVFVAATGQVARTFPARWPLLPLDRIYVRNAHATQTRVLSARPWSHLSDHAPLAAELQW
jgi:endonuclease/exonuclease/phosphatase family metal-dependent hydrolase